MTLTTEHLRTILFAALEKIAKKETRRELLEAGTAHRCTLSVSGTIDGLVFRGEKIEGNLAIGHDWTKASSTAAPPAEVVAYLLALLPKTKRTALLAELPDAFLRSGGKLPAIDANRLAEAETLLERLRSRKDQQFSGSVTWSYAAPPPKPAARKAA
jgi:hypothetical protein